MPGSTSKRILKVFATGAEQDRLAETVDVLERYDAFLLAEASPAVAKKLAREQLVEDVTDQYEIPLGAGAAIDTTTPRVDERGAIRAHPAYRRGASLPEGPHHYLVQFVGPIKDSWLRGVKRAGGEPRQLYGDFVFVVRADEEAVAKIAALPYVRWTGHLPHEERLAESVREELEGDAATLPRTRLLPRIYTVEFFGAKDIPPALTEVRKLGVEILVEEPDGKILVVQTSDKKGERKKQLEGLSRVHGVRKVRQRAVRRPSNDVAASLLGTASSLGSALGLSGKGETVAVCDTGLDTGLAATIHPDFSGRVRSITSYPMTSEYAPFVRNPGGDDGPADLDSGHGTHTAGSVLGSGAASAGMASLAAPVRGLAHGARLVFQAVEQECKWKNPEDVRRLGRYALAGIPADLKTLLADAYSRGARIHSNSWGGGDPGAYDDQCRAVDQFVWEHKTFCVVAAAGNDGTDFDGDGRINPMSVSSPATAKNCITVGASENRRPGFSRTYGGAWPRDYPVAPFKADRMADDPNQVAAFSSRGPTKDRRYSPHVVAPGTFVLSTRSTMIALNNTAWGAFPESRLYFYMGGTSMATPLVSGAVAALREYLRRKRSIASPTAALLKAALIAGARRLPGSGEPGAVVDNHQGYGRVDLDAIVAPPGPASTRFTEVRPGLRTGEVRSSRMTVKSNASPLRIALAWSDPPGPALVNNLNLIVTAPDGGKLVGNQRRNGPPTLDAANNTELVHVEKPAAGVWRVEVVGSNVARGPQDFALVSIAHF
jgi:subtilisin family serine protease